MKKIFILGASGSIGENALSVIDSNKENFELIGISANSNVEKVNKVIKKYNPKYIYINDKSCLLYTSPSPRDLSTYRMPSSA